MLSSAKLNKIGRKKMSLNLADKNWLTKSEFKKVTGMSDSTFYRRISKDMRFDPRFMNGYAAVTQQEVYINIAVYNAWKNAKAEERFNYIDY